MSTNEGAEESEPVNGDWPRGQEIKRRRLLAGIKSLREFAEATGVSRNAITAAEDGHGSRATYERLESWLDRFVEETGEDEPPPRLEQVVIVVDGERVTVTVNGPIRDAVELENSVARIIRGIRSSTSDE